MRVNLAELATNGGEGYDRSESVAGLRALRDRCGALAWVLAGRVMVVAELEAKLAIAKHIYELVVGAEQLQHRIEELDRSDPGLQQSTGAQRRRYDATMSAPTSAHLVAHIYGRELPALLDALDSYAAGAAPVLDAPSVRVVRQLRFHLGEVQTWGDHAVAAYLDALDAEEIAQVWEWQLGLDEIEPPPVRRPQRARRDERFSTFENTRSYDQRIEGHEGLSDYERDRLELIRVNRDEIDAVETFALALHDLIYEVPLAMTADLARFTWDESRHAQTGHALLIELGIDPFSVPCSMIGINVRGAMDGWDAFAQISVFGELSIIRPMRELATAATKNDDPLTARCFDFITTDESMHLTRGRAWLRTSHPAGGLRNVEEHVRRAAAKRLAEEGVVGEDYALAMTRSEIFEVIGE